MTVSGCAAGPSVCVASGGTVGSPHSGQKRVPGAFGALQRRQVSVRGAKSKSGAIGRCGGRLETRDESSDRSNVRCGCAGRSVPLAWSGVPQSAQKRS
jgi:hypothetical protein